MTNYPPETFIETASGIHINPLDPDPDLIDINDIAHALSLKCRWTGHCRVFFSIAQHSVMVSEFCPQVDALTGLLHDSAEAYLVDMAGPLKPYIPGYVEIEERLLQCILNKFGAGWPLPISVKYVDKRMMMTEGYAFMTDPGSWIEKTPPYDINIRPWYFKESKERFLDMFHALYKDGRK